MVLPVDPIRPITSPACTVPLVRMKDDMCAYQVTVPSGCWITILLPYDPSYAGEDDLAVADRVDRRALGGGEVLAGVRRWPTGRTSPKPAVSR